MQELALTPATVVLLLVIVGCAVLAVRRLLHRGLCDCDDHCSGCEGCQGAEKRMAHPPKASASGPGASMAPCCAAVEGMLERAEKAANRH